MWAATLHRELAGGGEQAPPVVLPALAVLDEIDVTTTSLIEGRGDIPEADRTSLGRDVSASLRHLGTATSAAVAPVLRQFQTDDVRPLPRLLTDVDGARRLRSAARLVAEELCLARVSEAAWDDCVAAFRDGADSATCQLRIAQLRELCLRRAHGWEAMASRLGGMLADQPHALLAGGATRSEVAVNDPREAARIEP